MLHPCVDVAPPDLYDNCLTKLYNRGVRSRGRSRWPSPAVRPMPTCQNCGSHVTRAYARVFTPDGVDDPRVCPRCDDKLREGAEVRDARAPRHR